MNRLWSTWYLPQSVHEQVLPDVDAILIFGWVIYIVGHTDAWLGSGTFRPMWGPWKKYRWFWQAPLSNIIFCLLSNHLTHLHWWLSFLDMSSDNLRDGSLNDVVEDGDTVLHLSCLYGYKSCVQVGSLISICGIFRFIVKEKREKKKKDREKGR